MINPIGIVTTAMSPTISKNAIIFQAPLSAHIRMHLRKVQSSNLIRGLFWHLMRPPTKGALGVTPAAPPLFATTPFIHPHCIIVTIPFNHGYARTCAQNPVYGAIVRSANPRPACVYLRCINAPYTSHIHFQLLTRTTRAVMRIMPVSNWKDIRSFPVPFRAVYNAVMQPKISVMHKPSHCNVVKR